MMIPINQMISAISMRTSLVVFIRDCDRFSGIDGRNYPRYMGDSYHIGDIAVIPTIQAIVLSEKFVARLITSSEADDIRYAKNYSNDHPDFFKPDADIFTRVEYLKKVGLMRGVR